ncbi:peptide ABC transporter substrate-binding protein [Enemella evansiae]|uniref:peptide ABC transporter substrate-binding protein n=1 Tax=Enemella evansiae TaxID=2016499 RepID=UPI00105F2AB7|nr:peptide ABC transporter substrate-binding protein [Enemella evansiae]TDO91394.1 peptide/nickel transport system substrate-binding protein [Enemella evansiae]
MGSIKRTSAARLVAISAAAVLALTACSSGGAGAGSTGQGPAKDGGSVSMALKTPSWILPIATPGHTQGENAIFISTLYRSVYSYALSGGGKYSIDEKRSIAGVPEVTADGKTYTVKLKDEKWSDGTAITTKDVQFWWNLVNANKDKWSSYRKGALPDNVAEFKVIDEQTFSITTTREYAPTWFVDNQLDKIYPLPAHAWDPEGKAATPEGAKEVFGTLEAAAKDTASYGTNPLWKTVSGAFTLESYVPQGEVKLAKNAGYTGADKPKLDNVVFRPFTGDDAEFNVLRSGGIDYGYIPAGNINQRKTIESRGYKVSPWYGWSISYMPFNFNNPKTGPIFKQLPVRQAMQMLIDQPTISRVVWQEQAAPTCGPVPQKPGSAGSMDGCAYQFDPEKAKQTLTENGWKVVPDGVTTCEKPGTGPGQCGEGVAAGAPLQFEVTSQSGFSATTKMMAELKSRFAGAGIQLTIKEVPDSVSVTQKCEPADPGCSWDLSFFGSQSSWYFPVYASGERLFASTGAVNLGSYSDPKADQLIDETQFSGDESAMTAYNDYLAKELPVLWMPNPVAQVSAYKSDITGIEPQDPTLEVYPQDWARTN